GPVDLVDAYLREFPDYDAMAAALAEHVRAAPARAAEEKLAFRVLGNLDCYEDYILDAVVRGLLTRLQSAQRLSQFLSDVADKASYGFGAVLPSGLTAGALMAQLDSLPPLERLYKKVATIHHFGRYAGRAMGLPSTPGRSAHTDQRFK